jgi:hypothetical protein
MSVKTTSFWTGALIAGALDISYAIGISYVLRGTLPSRILKSVASGWLGSDALNGGAGIAALGLASHFLIAIIWTAIYFAAASKIDALWKKPAIFGPLYGILIYGAMNYVVIPLSAIGRVTVTPNIFMLYGILVHMFLIGLVMALFARKAYR